MNTETYKEKLLAEQKTLMAELGGLGKRDPESKEWSAEPEALDESEADDNTRADRFETFEEKSALTTELQTRLDEVTSALANIEAGTYGRCSVCGNPIEEERLAANPAASTCVKHM